MQARKEEEQTMLEFIPETLRDVNLVSILLRIILSVFIGGIIGLEREHKNRPAGFRTHILVCLGAMLIMLTNQYVYQYYGASDPVRMGAQVVSGIGFLGAGTIMVTRGRQVKGMTTAAGMWASAGCGLAVGIGFYEGAVLVGITILIVMTVLRYFDVGIRRISTQFDIYLEVSEGHRLSEVLRYLREEEIRIAHLELIKSDGITGQSANLRLDIEKDLTPNQILVRLEEQASVDFVYMITRKEN